MMKKKKNEMKLDSHAKSSTISMILFRNVSLFPEENQQPVLGGNRFFQRKGTIFIGRETKPHILPTKMNEKKIAKVSPSNNNYSFRII